MSGFKYNLSKATERSKYLPTTDENKLKYKVNLNDSELWEVGHSDPVICEINCASYLYID